MTLADTPVWLSGLIMALIFPLAVEGGFLLHRRLLQRSGEAETGDGAGQIVAAALALLGLLIGFTFAMAADRYETRRQLVVEEANAISTTYLRQQLFDEPARGRLSALTRDYIRARLAFVAAGVDQKRLDAVDARTAAIQDRIWAETAAVLRTPTGSPLTTSVLQATNAAFDLAATRRAALEARVPQGVLWALASFALATAAIMGYGLAAGGRRHRVASSGLFVLVALAIALIVDLDQPRSGLITIVQTPLDRAAASILGPPPI